MSGQRREDDRRDDGAPAAFAVECPGCRAHVAVSRGLVGHVAGCPHCHAAFLVPVPGPEERRPPRPAADGRRAAPDVAAPEPQATALPEPVAPAQSSDEPLVFSEPPVPSTRRLRDEALVADPVASTVAANLMPDPTAMAAAVPAVVADVPTFRDTVRVIRSGGAEIELHRLTPEEKRARRARRNLILLVVGAALLVALVVVLGKGGR